jgi:hypothetical protein
MYKKHVSRASKNCRGLITARTFSAVQFLFKKQHVILAALRNNGHGFDNNCSAKWCRGTQSIQSSAILISKCLLFERSGGGNYLHKCYLVTIVYAHTNISQFLFGFF